MSLRQCAQYLTENEFPISYVTVKDYIERGKMIHKSKFDEARKVLETNKSKTIDDEDVLNRVKNVYELLKQGFTFEEIAKKLNSTQFVVYRDFENRIQMLSDKQIIDLGINKEEIISIEQRLTQNSLDNLKKVV